MQQPPLDDRKFRRLIDGALSEREWQRQVERALDACHWWWMHIPSNVVVCNRCGAKVYRQIKRGFPDILAIRPPHILWIELKVEQRGTLRPEQRTVREMLQACGQTFIHARPRDRQRLLEIIVDPTRAPPINTKRLADE